VTKNLKLSLGLAALALLAFIAFASTTGGSDDAEPAANDSERLVRPDSQVLSQGNSDVTFVEFLDFECEACRAAHPAVEQLRETYGDRVTFVVRNMPLHNNSRRAARAAEAAAAQGKFEEMYDLLFETQPTWGESSESKEQVFFDLAEQLGLDMDDFEQVYNDPATAELVERDFADGKALGVTGTPTFFIDGEQVEVSSFDDLVTKLDDALER
jgi:protein-disulfide isomerase